jgi:mRNA interferase MazF
MPASDLSCRPGTIVRVPFPCTDGPARQYRPALVVAEIRPRAGEQTPFLRVVMITSAENRGWSGDVAVPDDDATGLPIPSVVRNARIATIERPRAEPRGTVPPQGLARVARSCLPGSPPGSGPAPRAGKSSPVPAAGW